MELKEKLAEIDANQLATLEALHALSASVNVLQCVCVALVQTHPNRAALFEAFSQQLDAMADTITPDELVRLRRAREVWTAALSG